MDASHTEALSDRRLRAVLLLQLVLLVAFGRQTAARFVEAAGALEGAGPETWLAAAAFPLLFGLLVTSRLRAAYWRGFFTSSTLVLMLTTTARWLPRGELPDALFLVLGCSWLFLTAGVATLFLRERLG